MPKFANDTEMDTHQVVGTGFQFSAAKITTLGASEYTLGVVVVDRSGSVSGFSQEIEGALKEVVKACRRNPRADSMMLQVILFDHEISELHGMRPLPNCNEQDYTGCVVTRGSTALFDAVYSAVKAVETYAKDLVAQQFLVNAAVFVITDGADNASKVSKHMVAEAIQEARTSETLESIMPVLIGVNTDVSGLNTYLQAFQAEAGFQQYVAIGHASEKELAKLGGFISRSMSSQSQALGSGGASQSLSF